MNRERSIWRRSSTAIGRLFDRVPLTLRGLWVGLLSGAALRVFGVGALDLVLFVVGICGGALVVLAATTSILLSARLRSRLRGARGELSQLEAEAPARTGFEVPAFSRWPLVRVAWCWERPAEVEVRRRAVGGLWAEEVVARRRARVDSVRRRMSVGDAFGLTGVSWVLPGEALTVLPGVGRLRSLAVVQSLAGAEGVPHPAGAPEGDLMEIRRYVPGDSMRHVLWKVFARTRQLNVRLPERSVERSERTVAYLLTGEGDEPAAAAARVALESGALGPQWLFGSDGTGSGTEALAEALEMIARSGSTEAAPEGLERFLGEARQSGETHCVVFAPARPGPWLERALRAARAHPGALAFVLGTDGLTRAPAEARWQRWLVRQESVEGTSTEELSGVLQRLHDAGCPAVVVDRRSGKTFGESLRRARGLDVA